MKNLFKGKAGTAIILVFTVILAGVAIFTAVRLYQLRQQAVAPNVPSSIPQAQEASPSPVSACLLTFTIGATPTGTPSATPTPTGSPTTTPTGTATPTPTNSATPTSTSSSTPVSSTATPASLPQSGTSWPTLMGAGLGILVILGSLLLVL